MVLLAFHIGLLTHQDDNSLVKLHKVFLLGVEVSADPTISIDNKLNTRPYYWAPNRRMKRANCEVSIFRFLFVATYLY